MRHYGLGFIYCLIFSIFMSKGNGLECYDCEGNEYDPKDCYDVNEKTNKKSVFDTEKGFFSGENTKAACLKSRGKAPGFDIVGVTRRAVNVPTGQDETTFCDKNHKPPEGMQDHACKICFTDLCNSSISKKQGYLTFYIAIVGLLVNIYM